MISPELTYTRTHTHALRMKLLENPTGVILERTERTTRKDKAVNLLKINTYTILIKRTIHEPKTHQCVLSVSQLNALLKNKKYNEINKVRFLVRSGALLERTTEAPVITGFKPSLKVWFAGCAQYRNPHSFR